ncbi:MAG: dihydroorotase, partial [Telluria sp.]
KVTSDAARVAGLNAGTLGAGVQADVIVFDPQARWKVEAAALASQGKHTPFIGYELAGQVRFTIVGGHVAYQR